MIAAWLLALWVSACAGTGTIDSHPKAEIFLFGQNNNQMTKKEESPIAVKTDGAMASYVFQRRHQDPEYLLVFQPRDLKGPLVVALDEGKAKKPESLRKEAESAYFDRLLRAQRLLLRGHVAEAKEVISALDGEFEPSYGTMVLLGNAYLVEGQTDAALRIFEGALLLMPDSDDLKKLIESLRAGGAS